MQKKNQSTELTNLAEEQRIEVKTLELFITFMDKGFAKVSELVNFIQNEPIHLINKDFWKALYIKKELIKQYGATYDERMKDLREWIIQAKISFHEEEDMANMIIEGIKGIDEMNDIELIMELISNMDIEDSKEQYKKIFNNMDFFKWMLKITKKAEKLGL